MPKCRVTTSLGEHCIIEAHGFAVLDSGFVALKRRRDATPEERTRSAPALIEETVAIFYHPDKVQLELPDNTSGNASEGSFAG